MREKCEQGQYPYPAPYGYFNNRITRTIEPHPEKSRIVLRLFELFASDQYTIKTVRIPLREEFGRAPSKSAVHRMLTDDVYIGKFTFRQVDYDGLYETFISLDLFNQVQSVLKRHNRPKQHKHEFPFRPLLNCAFDGCTVTAERQKGHVYYHCTHGRGRCELPWFRQERLAERLACIFDGISIPVRVAEAMQDAISRDEQRVRAEAVARRRNLTTQLENVRRRMSAAFTEKIDGKIPEDFWHRQMTEWNSEEQRIELALQRLNEPRVTAAAVKVHEILELAKNASSLYVRAKPEDQARLLRTVLSNCRIDAVSVYPTYRKPFDIIFEHSKTMEWCPCWDSIGPSSRRSTARTF